MTLAERLDKIMHDFDPYSYADMEGSVEQAEYCIENKPLEVIEELVGMIEELMED